MYSVLDQRTPRNAKSSLSGSALGFSILDRFDRELPFRGFAIKYVLRGTERYTVNGKQYAVPDGSYLLANGHCAGRVVIDSATPVLGLCANLSAGTINGMMAACALPEAIDEPELPSFLMGEKFPEGVRTVPGTRIGLLMHELAHGMHADPYTHPNMDANVFLALAEAAIVDHVGMDRALHNVRAVRSGTRKDIYRRVERARAFMHERTSSAIDVASMAKEAAMSEFHFFRAFRAIHGLSPYQYVLALRLENARRALLTGESVSHVALSNGFADIQAFSKAYKRRFGHAPSLTAGGSSRI